ncbi:CPBP family intramembrane metalloprotease [bacterium]|nr:MAG: CPBP family intramembrane metalloprotease [bacterium]
MRKALNLFLALVLYFSITIINVQLFLNPLVIPLFPSGYIREHFWIRDYIHHFVQMFLALVVIVFILKGRFKDYGLNLQNWDLSKKYILWFFLVYGVFTALNFLPNFLNGEPEPVNFSLTTFNILGWFSFTALMSGTSEEIFFRGLLQTFLNKAWKGSVKIAQLNIPTAGIIAALIFTFAHMEFNFDPFAVSYNIPQLIVAFILGIFYSVAYDRSKSLIAPIVAHNYANFIMYFIGYLTIILFS